ncbi:MAG TPA: type I phosphomannose isomerase catalytic subunit [Terriglobales bacterium]|nr:type I phosphomannose isomerase catalytic subunit [Terriglobales bacterium]
MAELYPFLLSPYFSPRPWGGVDLSPIYPDRRFEEKIGESWLTGDDCCIANGPLAGHTLSQVTQEYGRALVGEAAREELRFPLLLKFLFPHDKLSVQVHPDDECARRVGQPWGKTECWYVADAKPGAQIALGLKPGVTCADLEDAIRRGRAEDSLNWIDVKRGEMIYVAAGTVHAIGAGSILVETQQSSDTTYRLYDYGRPRELHLEKGLAAVKEKPNSGKVVLPHPNGTRGNAANQHAGLVRGPYFVVEKFTLREPEQFSALEGKNSVQILVAIEGCGVLESPGGAPVTFACGDAVVVPASIGEFRVQPQWQVEFLRASVPGNPFPDPVVQ